MGPESVQTQVPHQGDDENWGRSQCRTLEILVVCKAFELLWVRFKAVGRSERDITSLGETNAAKNQSFQFSIFRTRISEIEMMSWLGR